MEDAVGRQLKQSLALNLGAEACAEVPSPHPDRRIDGNWPGLFDPSSDTPGLVGDAANDEAYQKHIFV
jgi:hypothetical protein